MNVYWNGQFDRRPQHGEEQDHRSRFDLSFGRHGERTIIERQYVSYPFHLTRPFALDPDIPALTTVYQQSSSGGVYRSDRLTSQIKMGRERPRISQRRRQQSFTIVTAVRRANAPRSTWKKTRF